MTLLPSAPPPTSTVQHHLSSIIPLTFRLPLLKIPLNNCAYFIDKKNLKIINYITHLFFSIINDTTNPNKVEQEIKSY